MGATRDAAEAAGPAPSETAVAEPATTAPPTRRRAGRHVATGRSIPARARRARSRAPAARRVRADPRDRDQELPGPGVLHPVRVDGADAPPRRPRILVCRIARCSPMSATGTWWCSPIPTRRPTRIAAWSAGSSTVAGGRRRAARGRRLHQARGGPRRGYLGDPPRQAVRERRPRPRALPLGRTRYPELRTGDGAGWHALRTG